MRDDSDNFHFAAISCPTADDCVMVGNYEVNEGTDNHLDYLNYGLIVSDRSGVWSFMNAPVPANAALTPTSGEWVGADVDTVDCPGSGSCLAGGVYADSGYEQQPLLIELISGSWTPSEGPVPPDSQPNVLSNITGVSCPAVGSCFATGSYWVAFDTDEDGMLLTQSNGSWTALADPVNRGDAVSTLAGVSCSGNGLCASVGSVSVGNDAASYSLETDQIAVPSVSAVAPPDGPLAGGTTVTVTGSNFSPATTVDFGGRAASSTTFVSSSELLAVSPAQDYGLVDVTVSTGGETRGQPGPTPSHTSRRPRKRRRSRSPARRAPSSPTSR